jgi:hypothetical protein
LDVVEPFDESSEVAAVKEAFGGRIVAGREAIAAQAAAIIARIAVREAVGQQKINASSCGLRARNSSIDAAHAPIGRQKSRQQHANKGHTRAVETRFTFILRPAWGSIGPGSAPGPPGIPAVRSGGGCPP